MEVVFAVGCERSGNTMFARLLRAHPDILVLAEVKFLQEVLIRHGDGVVPRDEAESERLLDDMATLLAHSKYANFDSGWNRETAALLADAVDDVRQTRGVCGLRDVLDALHRAVASRGKRALVYGEPSLVYFLPEMAAILGRQPAAATIQSPKYIQVLRDGLNVANSIARVPTMPSGSFGPAMRWKRAVKAWSDFVERHPRAPTLTVTYEELIEQQTFDQQMALVYDFLGVTRSGHRELAPELSRTNFEGTTSTVPEPQRTPLSIDVQTAHFLMHDELRARGYERAVPLPRPEQQLALKQRELDYWLEVRAQVAAGRLAHR